MLKRYWTWAAAFVLLVVFVTEVALSTRHMSLSWDEGDHIYSGYENWKNGEYSLNPEHPPLVKLVATLPLLPLELKVAPREGRFFKSEAYYGGRELLFRNDPQYGGKYSADTLVFRIHMAVLVFAVMLAVLLFLAGREMFGAGAGLIAMALFVFDPTVLTNAPYVTTDTGAACGFFAGVYLFYRFAKEMRWSRALACGVVTGLAMTAKHSAVMLLPFLVLLALGEIVVRWRTNRAGSGRFALRMVGALAGIGAVAITVLWAVYSFRYAMHSSGTSMPSFASHIGGLSPRMRWLLSFCANHHLLPESYLYGMADVQAVGLGMPAYIFGKLYAHGQWFYFPALLSLKWSVGVLGLLAVSAYAVITKKIKVRREILYLAVPAALYLGIAMGSPLNIGVRHVLPVFPFVFALAGAGGAWLAQRSRVGLAVVSVLLLCHAADSVRMFPNYMPYANVFWGGPAKTHEYFSDSATNWGQELKLTKEWVDAHQVKECWYAYFPGPFLLPSDYGIPCKLLPTLDTMYEYDITLPPVVHGPVLVSYADLNGFEFGSKVRNPYQALFERKPDDVIANGVAVFYGDFALPDAAALQYHFRASSRLGKDPKGALELAMKAVDISPRNYDANLVLGDALHANGDDAGARQAYLVAQSRIAEMEPSLQEQERPEVEKKLVKLGASGTTH
jgi:hypothetical protein